MIHRGDTSPTGWTTYECSDCQAQWQVHAHEDPKVVTEHPEAECLGIQKENAELVELRKKHPNRAFARSAIGGGFIPI